MRFYFLPCDAALVVNNKAVTPPYQTECNDSLIIAAVRENTCADLYYAPVFGVIKVAAPPRVFGAIKLIDWGQDCFDVRVDFSPCYVYAPPTAIAQSAYNHSGNIFTATVYKDNRVRLLIECNDKTAVFPLPDDLSDTEILFRPTRLGFLTVVKGSTSGGQHLAFLLYDGVFTLLFDKTVERAEFSGNSFTVYERLYDMLGRTRVTEYSFSGKELIILKTSFSYTHEKKYPAELTPYLLIEAVKAGDTEAARGYLTAALAPDAPKLSGYFGDFDFAECPRHRAYKNKRDLTEVALMKNFNSGIFRPRILSFALTPSGKISNIDG